MFNKLFKNRMQGKNKPKEQQDSNDIKDNLDLSNEDIINETSEINETEQPTPVSELDKLTSENEELKDKYLRLYSDFENYKRRTTKERIDLFKMAGQDVLKSLIPVLDDFERAEKAFESSTDAISLAEGVKLVSSKLKNTLEQQGLKSYISIGEKFDADLHEAITKIPAPSKDLKGKIIDEIEKGYKLQDKVIRFAKVIIGE
ncbi:MAG: nucleotide exchange factor GrpE [Bacteroidia bacterium]